MSVMVIYESAGVGQDKYEQIMRELGSLEAAPEGGLADYVGFDGPDIVVVDIWDSRAHAEEFGKRLLPVLAKHGATGKTVGPFELHSLASHAALAAYSSKLTPA